MLGRGRPDERFQHGYDLLSDELKERLHVIGQQKPSFFGIGFRYLDRYKHGTVDFHNETSRQEKPDDRDR